MKKIDISIDANDIKQKIIDQAMEQIVEDARAEVDKEIKKAIGNEVKECIQKLLTKEVPKLLDFEFTPIGNYGDVLKPTTLRNAIIETVRKELVFNHRSYSSDMNMFSNIVTKAIEGVAQEAKKEIQLKIDSEFTKQALDYAAQALKTKLGIK